MRLTHLHIPTRFLTRSGRKTDTYARSVQGAQAIAKGVGRPLRQPGARVGRQCEPSMFTGSAPPKRYRASSTRGAAASAATAHPRSRGP